MDWSCLVLRLGLGIMFVAHGLQMAYGLFKGPGIKGFSAVLSSLGFTPAIVWAYVGAYTTLVGGLFLISGLFTRTSALFLLIFIVVAGIKVHLKKGFFLADGGFEYTFVIASVCLALVIQGAGKFSLLNKF